jgi:hypothetical protein
VAVRRWLPIVLGVLLVLVLGIGGLIGSCAYMVRRQVQVTARTSVAEYDREANAILRRFPGVPVLVEDGPSGPALSQEALAIRQKRPPTRPLRNLHVLVFSTNENKLVRLSLPFWLLRLAPDGHTGIDVNDVDLDKLRLSVDDIESAGPGPLLVRRAKDAHVLVWAE